VFALYLSIGFVFEFFMPEFKDYGFLTFFEFGPLETFRRLVDCYF
jgi:hypothetical protein